MKNIFWLYTVAAVLALNSTIAAAGQVAPKGPSIEQSTQELLQQTEQASFEEIANLQSKLESIRSQVRKDKIDSNIFRHIDEIQNRIDALLSTLVKSMK